MRLAIPARDFGKYAPKVLERLESAGFQLLRHRGSQHLAGEKLVELIADAELVIAGGESYDAKTLSSASHLKALIRMGSGCDNLDLATMQKRSIQCAYTPEAATSAVAELTLGLILDLMRGIARSDRAMRQGKWIRHTGVTLEGKRVGILGLGRIGQAIARLLQACGCEAIPYAGMASAPTGVAGPRYGGEVEVAAPLQGVETEPFYAWLSDLDLVTVHVPLTRHTRGLFDVKAFAAMKPGAFFVNTSRGAVVEESALFFALQSGHLAGAALDVFGDEPYFGPLAGLPQTVVTAHMGAATQETRARMEIAATEEAIRYKQHLPFLSPLL